MPKKEKDKNDKPIFSYEDGTLTVTPQTSYLGRTFVNPVIGPAAIVVNKTNVNVLETASMLARNQYTSKGEDGKSKLSISKLLNPFKAVRLACNIAQFGIGTAIDSLGPNDPNTAQRVIQGTIKAVLIAPITVINTVIAPAATIEEVPDRLSTALGLKEAAKASSAAILGSDDNSNTFDPEELNTEVREPEARSPRASVIRAPTDTDAGKTWSSAQTESASKAATVKSDAPEIKEEPTQRLR